MADLRGHLLIAMPGLLDPNFYRSVVLIVRHDTDGAMGVILNRPLEVTIKDAWAKVDGGTCTNTSKLHAGGPCPGPLLALHDGRRIIGERIIDGLHYSIDADDIRKIIEENIQPSRFFVGNAGWSPNQLESEIGTASWLTCPATETVAFADIRQEQMWIMFTRIATMRAITPNLSHRFFPADPQLN